MNLHVYVTAAGAARLGRDVHWLEPVRVATHGEASSAWLELREERGLQPEEIVAVTVRGEEGKPVAEVSWRGYVFGLADDGKPSADMPLLHDPVAGGRG